MNKQESKAIVMNPAVPLPKPRVQGKVSTRLAVMGDLPFIDALQKMHSHMVGFFPNKQLEKYIEDENALVAEEHAQNGSGAVQIGYCLFKDQYMKRDDVGIIYQLNVMPIRHRHLVGATLVKAVFDQAAYGCRLFSCWCAQDIQANYFWESIGFVPLAFRTGSRSKQRIHIFWQRRVRAEENQSDTGETPVPLGSVPLTPYWFPSQTQAGAIAEDRIVLPIPPETHWRDAKPMVLPGLEDHRRDACATELPLMLPGGQPVRARPEKPKLSRQQKAALERCKSAHLGGAPIGKKAVMRGGRVKYVDIPGFDPATDVPDELLAPEKAKRPRKVRQKNDPKYVKAARELRDRYLEEVNTGRFLPAANGKYDVSRQLMSAPGPGISRVSDVEQVKLLDAA